MRVVLVLGLFSLLDYSQCLPNLDALDIVDNRQGEGHQGLKESGESGENSEGESLEKHELETTILSCAAENTDLATRLSNAFYKCRQHTMLTPNGKSKSKKGKGKSKSKSRQHLSRQGKKMAGKKKGKKVKKSKKGKGSRRCLSVDQLHQKIEARSLSIKKFLRVIMP